MDESAIEDFVLPKPVVEQFVRRLKARLFDPPELTNREICDILASRLGMTKGPCRIQLDFQEGLCTKIIRQDVVGAKKLDEAAPWPG